MIGFHSGYEFDRDALKRRWKRLNGTPLVRASAYVQRTAINSIRKASRFTRTMRLSKAYEKPSAPNTPPKSRAPGHPLRRILFAISTYQTSAVIGPVGFTSRRSPQSVASIHEFGLFAKRTRRRIVGWHTVRIGGKKRPRPMTRRGVAGSVKYPTRPFMGPALAKAAPKLPAMWKGSVKS